MKRVFQPSINAATQELVEEGLKSMMEHPKNSELIDNYRKMKRQMKEALAHQAVDTLVREVTECEAYRKWLAKELKKDERRTKKRMPDDDLNRVKLYIGQLKTSLPAVIPTVTHFTESKDQWGRIGLWRVQSNGYLSGLAIDDFDHVQNPEERINEWLQREDFKDLGIVWIFITPSGEGIKLVFKAREEWGNLQDNAYQMAEILGMLDYCDSQTKNADHAHFIPKMSDVKYIDWKELFTYENPAYEARFGEAYRRGESEPTQPRWQELERQRSEARKQTAGATAPQPTVAIVQKADAPVEFSPEDEAFIKVLNEYYGAALPPHTKHDRMQTETSHWLCYYNDNDPEKAIQMAYRLDWVKAWNPNPGEVEDLCQSAAKKKMLSRYPKVLKELMEKAGVDSHPTDNQPATADDDLPTEEWVEQIRGFFDHYPCMREICENSQERLWPFMVFATAGLAGTLMTLTWWFSYDNPYKKRRLNYNILGIGDPAVGKGPLEDLCEAWIEPIAQADKLVNDTTNEWKEQMRSKGANKDKAAKPKGVVRIHGARTSNNVFINDMMNAWTEVDGERMHIHMLTYDSEALNSIKMAKGGSWIDRSVMEIKAWSNEKDSQQYSNLDSMTGSFNVFWNQIRTCTPPALKVLANERNFGSGWPLRVSVIPVPDNDFDMIPLHTRNQKSGDSNTIDTIREWAYRLDKRRGELPIWPLVEHAWHWTNDHMEVAKFNNDKAERMLLKRITQTTLCIAAPWVDMRHWQERENTGTYQVDDTDMQLLDLLLDIQYKTQRHYFYELARNYYDEQKKDATTFRRRTTRFEQCYQQLPEKFTTEQFTQVFGYANSRSASKTIDRFLKDKAIERTKRGEYRKRVQSIS